MPCAVIGAVWGRIGAVWGRIGAVWGGNRGLTGAICALIYRTYGKDT